MGDRHLLEDLRASQRRTLTRAMPTITRSESANLRLEGKRHADELQLRLVAQELIAPHRDVVDGLELAQAVRDVRQHVKGLKGERWVEPAASHLDSVVQHLLEDGDGSWYVGAAELSTERDHADQFRRLRGALLLLEAADLIDEASASAPT